MKLSSKELKALIEEVKAENNKNLIKESGFPRVRQIMLGQIPSIDSLAILTAENPMGKPHSKAENELRNKELMTDLRSMNYGPIPLKGRFGGPESSFIVPNISRDEAIQLGNKHQQDAQSREDYYSAKKGKKFYIPFFDDEFEGAVPVEGGRKISQPRMDNTEKDTRLGPEPEVSNYVVERRISFFDNEIPKTKEAKTLAASIKMRTSFLAESERTEKSKWHHRGMIKEEMRKLQRLIDYARSK